MARQDRGLCLGLLVTLNRQRQLRHQSQPSSMKFCLHITSNVLQMLCTRGITAANQMAASIGANQGNVSRRNALVLLALKCRYASALMSVERCAQYNIFAKCCFIHIISLRKEKEREDNAVMRSIQRSLPSRDQLR